MWRAGFRIELPCSGTLSMRLTRRGPKERICLYKMQSRSQTRLRNVLNRRISVRKHSGYERERRKQTVFVQNEAERTARLTTSEDRFYYWLGKRVLQRTGRNKDLMRTALRASCGLADHFSLREKIRFII